MKTRFRENKIKIERLEALCSHLSTRSGKNQILPDKPGFRESYENSPNLEIVSLSTRGVYNL